MSDVELLLEVARELEGRSMQRGNAWWYAQEADQARADVQGEAAHVKALAFMAGLWSVSRACGSAYAVEACVIRMMTIVAVGAADAKQGAN